MQIGRACERMLLASAFLAMVNMADAEPGDAEAVRKARKDYALAMRGHDAGLQNAMRAQLAAQLAMFREKATAKKRHPSNAPRPPRADTPAN